MRRGRGKSSHDSESLFNSSTRASVLLRVRVCKAKPSRVIEKKEKARERVIAKLEHELEQGGGRKSEK